MFKDNFSCCFLFHTGNNGHPKAEHFYFVKLESFVTFVYVNNYLYGMCMVIQMNHAIVYCSKQEWAQAPLPRNKDMTAAALFRDNLLSTMNFDIIIKRPDLIGKHSWDRQVN